MDLDPPLPRGNLFLSSTSSYSVRSFARGEREKEKEKEREKRMYRIWGIFRICPIGFS